MKSTWRPAPAAMAPGRKTRMSCEMSYANFIKNIILFGIASRVIANMRALARSSLEMRSALPLYKQIESDILQCLASGEWKPGDQLPTEPELAKRFGVAIYTVRAGIGSLVTAGILT